MRFFQIIFLLFHIKSALFNVQQMEDNSHWFNLGKADLEQALHLETITNDARNIVLFVGDGMGLTTVTASRIYAKSEAGFLAFEKFPHIGSLKTYNADKLVSDSSSTATALFSGVKANYKTSGVDPTVKLDDCDASLKPQARIKGIITWAQNAGKSTGFVTTTRVTHATPSALYSHTPNRKWECESTKPDHAHKCKDIAKQLIEDEPGRSINVIMGGGRQCLQSHASPTSDDPIDQWACYSQDGRDLIHDWIMDKQMQGKRHAFIANSSQLESLDPNTEYVLGIFANGHMAMDYKRPLAMPSLIEMTTKAIEILSKNPQGYFLMVEGGLIDFAHHRGHAHIALSETAVFSEAISAALQIINPAETLVIVTSDHAHSLVFSGYASRNTSILDVAQMSKFDDVPYTSLLYGTGGPNNYQFSVINGTVARDNPLTKNTTDYEYSQQAAILTDEVTHGGSDVLVYAKGPQAHLFHSVHDQTYVAYVMAYAAKIGPFTKNNGSDKFTSILLISFGFIVVNKIL